ncbi:MAG: type II toxin-antitoxin system RelE/ParE family toxin [Desulfobacteraceae bacterium]|nr:MAG: type II toxin-antitoxin system RelE/ParE family toxin [Desulfobacteraceae bacterium]
MKIEILDSAEEDLIDGFKFYEDQSRGLGDYFLDSLFSDIESLRVYAGIHALHFGYHRLLSKRFPFAIYYRLHSKIIRVFAVLDCRRSPAWTRNRLS